MTRVPENHMCDSGGGLGYHDPYDGSRYDEPVRPPFAPALDADQLIQQLEEMSFPSFYCWYWIDCLLWRRLDSHTMSAGLRVSKRSLPDIRTRTSVTNNAASPVGAAQTVLGVWRAGRPKPLAQPPRQSWSRGCQFRSISSTTWVVPSRLRCRRAISGRGRSRLRRNTSSHYLRSQSAPGIIYIILSSSPLSAGWGW